MNKKIFFLKKLIIICFTKQKDNKCVVNRWKGVTNKNGERILTSPENLQKELEEVALQCWVDDYSPDIVQWCLWQQHTETMLQWQSSGVKFVLFLFFFRKIEKRQKDWRVATGVNISYYNYKSFGIILIYQSKFVLLKIAPKKVISIIYYHGKTRFQKETFQ